MFYGIERNNLAYVQKVLAMNFDANLQHENGYTPLAYASMRGNRQMVELLLGNSASAALTTRDGDTPVELALRMGHSEIADLLRETRQAEQQKAQPQPA
jgi:ankyrin repeat protein